MVSSSYTVAEWYGAGFATRDLAGSNPTNGCCVPRPTQHVIPPGSVNEYQRKLGSKRAYNTIHWPHIRGLAASACVRLWAMKPDQRRPMGLKAWERTLLFYYGEQ